MFEDKLFVLRTSGLKFPLIRGLNRAADGTTVLSSTDKPNIENKEAKPLLFNTWGSGLVGNSKRLKFASEFYRFVAYWCLNLWNTLGFSYRFACLIGRILLFVTLFDWHVFEKLGLKTGLMLCTKVADVPF